MNSPETSIVIRAFNEERWLPEVFSALGKQRYRDFEVILVDSGSVDRTRDIASANGARIVRLRSEDFTFGHSLNVGIRESHGKFIAIISAHAFPADEIWLEKIIAQLRLPHVAMVYGGQRGHDISKFSESRDFERMFPQIPGESHEENPFANNANSAIKREYWEQHPFDEGLPGLEDMEWAKYWIDRGKKVLYEPDACIVHVHTESWAQVRRRYYREGMAARWIGLKILRHIPGELWRELNWGMRDLTLAASQGKFTELTKEIIRFRYEKTMGTIGGIVDSRGLRAPGQKAEAYFQKGFPALVVHGPNRLRIEEKTVPSLKPGEILVRISHAGICATDLEIVEGRLGYYQSGMASYPIVPGHESSGTVVALGPRVTEFKEGDRVVVECIQGCGECPDCLKDQAIRCRDRREVGVIGQDGAFAFYMVTRARYAHLVPDSVTLAQAALTEPLAVVIKGLRRLGSNPQDDARVSCAVVGAGTIGHLAAQVLTQRGHSVTVIDKSSERLNLLSEVVEKRSDLDDVGRYDWIVEATGDQGVLTNLLHKSATGSTLLLLGLPYSENAFNFESVVAYDRTIVGSVGSSGGDFDNALKTLQTLDTKPFLKVKYPLEDYENALKAANSRSVLKVMFTTDSAAE